MPSLTIPDNTRLETSGISDSIARAIAPVVAQPAGAIEQASQDAITALREGFASGENLGRLPLRNAAARDQMAEFNERGKLRPITQATEEARLKLLNDEMAELPLKRERAEAAYQYGIKQQQARQAFRAEVAGLGSGIGREEELNRQMDAEDQQANQKAMEDSQAPDAKGGVVSQDDILKRLAARKQKIDKLTKPPTFLDVLGVAAKHGYDLTAADQKELQDDLTKRGIAAFSVPEGYRAGPIVVRDDGSTSRTYEPIPPIGAPTPEKDINGNLTGYLITADGKRVPAKSASEKALTQDQSNARIYGRRMELNESTFEGLIAGGFDPASIQAGIATAKWMPNLIKGKDTQSYVAAKGNWISAVLRKESGAAISAAEFDSADLQYFPQFGDDVSVVNQKKVLRDLAKAEMKKAGLISEEENGDPAKGDKTNPEAKGLEAKGLEAILNAIKPATTIKPAPAAIKPAPAPTLPTSLPPVKNVPYVPPLATPAPAPAPAPDKSSVQLGQVVKQNGKRYQFTESGWVELP